MIREIREEDKQLYMDLTEEFAGIPGHCFIQFRSIPGGDLRGDDALTRLCKGLYS